MLSWYCLISKDLLGLLFSSVLRGTLRSRLIRPVLRLSRLRMHP